MSESFSARLTRIRGARLVAGLLLVVALLGLELARRPVAMPPAQAVWPVGAKAQADSPLQLSGRGHIPMPANVPTAHASNLLALPVGHPAAVMAFWFAGTRESAADVHIAASQFDRATQQ